jgi:hypothetical protein
MVERYGFELQWRGGRGHQVVPGERLGQGVRTVRHVHDVPQRRQLGPDLGDLAAPVHLLVAVGVAGHGEHHRRFDLGEPVDDAARAELGGAAGPDGAQAGGGEEGDERLGSVGQVADDPVATADAQPA